LFHPQEGLDGNPSESPAGKDTLFCDPEKK